MRLYGTVIKDGCHCADCYPRQSSRALERQAARREIDEELAAYEDWRYKMDEKQAADFRVSDAARKRILAKLREKRKQRRSGPAAVQPQPRYDEVYKRGVAWIDALVEKNDEELAAHEAATITLDREVDGRWIADIESMPGVMAYGEAREDAIRAVKELAKRLLDD